MNEEVFSGEVVVTVHGEIEAHEVTRSTLCESEGPSGSCDLPRTHSGLHMNEWSGRYNLGWEGGAA